MMPDKQFNPDDYSVEGEDDATIIEMLPKIRDLLSDVLDTYMSLDKDSKALLMAWIMAAPYYDAFDAFPYLFINASKSSGKSAGYCT